MFKRRLAMLGLIAALGLSAPALVDHGDKDKHEHGNQHHDRDEDQGGIAATDTNIGHKVGEMSALQDGIAARKPAGEIAVYLPGKPRNTDAGPTCTKAVRTTTMMRLGESSFFARSSRFMG